MHQNHVTRKFTALVSGLHHLDENQSTTCARFVSWRLCVFLEALAPGFDEFREIGKKVGPAVEENQQPQVAGALPEHPE